MLAKELLVEFYDASDDQLGTYSYTDTRRPRLTLRHLHKLRIAKDLEKVDHAQHLAFLPTMYNQADSEPPVPL